MPTHLLQQKRRQRRPRGISVALVICGAVLLAGMASFAIDYARVWMAKGGFALPPLPRPALQARRWAT